MPKVDGSERGVERMMKDIYLPPIEDEIDLNPPKDPCEGYRVTSQKDQVDTEPDRRTGSEIRTQSGGAKPPGHDPCYEDF